MTSPATAGVGKGELIDMSGALLNGGRVKVLARVENDVDGLARWACLCVCGTEFVKRGNQLRSQERLNMNPCPGCNRLYGHNRKPLDPREFERRERGKRKRDVRAKSEQPSRISRRRLRLLGDGLELDYDRPKTRADCKYGVRPCPYTACKYNLYLDVRPTGSITINFPDLQPDEMRESCALDVAGRGPATLEQVGTYLNITRERVRQIEAKILGKLGGEELAAELWDGPDSITEAE